MKQFLMIASALMLAACGEAVQVDTKAVKGQYTGKADTAPYANEQFKGDKAKWESALRARAENQNEYKRTQ